MDGEYTIRKQQFKNRGHFCNYCRKIISNKIKSTGYKLININQVIWYGWDHSEEMNTIIGLIKSIDVSVSNKEVNNQLRAILKKYGYSNKPTDLDRKKSYKTGGK
jgi:hypothetical protein